MNVICRQSLIPVNVFICILMIYKWSKTREWLAIGPNINKIQSPKYTGKNRDHIFLDCALFLKFDWSQFHSQKKIPSHSTTPIQTQTKNVTLNHVYPHSAKVMHTYPPPRSSSQQKCNTHLHPLKPSHSFLKKLHLITPTSAQSKKGHAYSSLPKEDRMPNTKYTHNYAQKSHPPSPTHIAKERATVSNTSFKTFADAFSFAENWP